MYNATLLGEIQLRRGPGAAPLHRQLADALRLRLRTGKLAPGSRLPATRTLGREIGVSRTTVVSAFEQLIAEGFLIAHQGAGTRVADFEALAALRPALEALTLKPQPPPRPAMPRTSTRAAFATGTPDIREFPLGIWSRILGRVSRQADGRLLDYADPAGHPELRGQIAEHLRQTRGMDCGVEQIIVCNGAQAAIDLIARRMLAPGNRTLIEDPSYPGAWSAVNMSGAALVPVGLDAEGLSLEQAALALPAAMIFVTPSYQYPMGITMSLKRRLELLEFANRHGCWILEDDYDSDLRYRGRPLAALQSLDGGGRVIYTGTFSKSMFAALRIGYIVAPVSLVDGFCRAMQSTGQQPSAILQAALATFMDEGHYAAHLRRIRSRYLRKQDLLVRSLRCHAAGTLVVDESDAGMQIVALFRQPLRIPLLRQRAAQRGLTIRCLSEFHLGNCECDGLLLGYAGIPEARIPRDCETLAAVLDGCR